ncbi:CBS domain-containing protein [bacterium]|nr:CBS domain-containing protein [bacterium]
MIKAHEIMTKKVITIHQDKTLLDTIEILVCKEISGLPVVDDKGKMVGIITEKDVLNFAFSGNLKNTSVKDVMTKEVKSFSPEDDVNAIALAISQDRFRRVPIIEDEEVVGIISRRDIIRAALQISCKT